MIKKIYIARHAFRMNHDWDVAGHSVTGTMRDPPLTAHGLDQIVQLAEHLKGKGIESIYCSPYVRCLQTATPIAERLGLPILVEHGLSEWYLPARTGYHPRPPRAESLKTHFPLISSDAHAKPLLLPSQKGETVSEVHDRAREVLSRLLESDEEHETVLLVTHAAVNIAIGRALLGDDRAVIKTPTASLGLYIRSEGGSGWRQELNGDASFLENGSEARAFPLIQSVYDRLTVVSIDQRDWCFEDCEEYEEYGPLDRPESPDEGFEARRRSNKL